MNTWAIRIKSRMKELGMTQEELASKMGITRGAVTHYLAGRRVPPLKQFQKLASILKADPAWLQFGTANEMAAKKIIEKKEKTIAKLPVPILSWEQAAEFMNVAKMRHDEIKELIPHFCTDKSRWYALRIKGDSMTAPLGQHKNFHENDIIIVDPDREAKHNDFVIALLAKAKEVTFKQYVVDGGVQYLKPLNPQYPIIAIDKGTHISGVVVGCITQFL
ncbi:MAG: helix-turn-helix domain-containing protein [Gammaproteobacteria bacterium]|nr:helix-turn-helix domain-containing protein [Gammaproteobacteria bacterium]